MYESLENAIEALANKSISGGKTTADEAMKYAQAVLNLAHAVDTLDPRNKWAAAAPNLADADSTRLPSRFQIDEWVNVKGHAYNTLVTAVKFSGGKVFYDVWVPETDSTSGYAVRNIPSENVEPMLQITTATD